MYNLTLWSERLMKYEKMSLMPFRNKSGKLTIGFGRNLDANPPNEEERRALGDYMHGITANAARMLLRNDIIRCYGALKNIVSGFEDLSPDRQYALLDMYFRLGSRRFKRLKPLIHAVEQGNFRMAAFECLTSGYGREHPRSARDIAKLLKGQTPPL